jgi:hypothetical protein
MIVYTRSHLRIAEVFFDEPVAKPRADILRYQARNRAVRAPNAYLFHTLVVDLDKTPDELLAGMNRNTRRDLNRARKDRLEFEFDSHPSDAWLDEFFPFWDRFGEMRGLGSANRTRTLAMRETGQLAMSRAKDANGRTLVWHTHLYTPQWVRGIYTASLRMANPGEASLTARANRSLHWHDLLRFREMGAPVYDFGGWYSGKEDRARLNVNRFKEGFGGRVVELFYADQGLTVKGSLAVKLHRVWGRLHGDTAEPGTQPQ